MQRESSRTPAATRIILWAVIELALGFVSVHAMPPLWIEAEDYAAQEGSRAPRFLMPTASGGACVDNDWGGGSKHFLRYDVELADDAAQLFVTLRYARETPGDAAVAVVVDGRQEHTRVARLPATGDWGFRPDGWKYAQVELPATAKGNHVFEIRSTAERNNVNFDGFYWSDAPLDTSRPAAVPPAGPDLIAALNPALGRLPCKTPVALPFSKRKAYVDGAGRVQTLVYREEVPLGAAWSAAQGSRLGPALQVMLDGQGPWRSVEQSFAIEPVPAVVTRFEWPDLRVEQTAFASAPESSGFWVRVRVENRAGAPQRVELVSLLQNAAGAAPDGDRWTAGGQPLLRAEAADGVETAIETPGILGPLGGPPRLRHRVVVPAQASRLFDLQFLGVAADREVCLAETQKAWRQRLAAAKPLRLPDPALQHAYDACLRQLLSLIEPWGNHARVLKGLEHYYGANPYDTFQASRALDAAGLHAEARELLCHQLEHLKADGIFEMWETGDLARAGADQWIVQGLAASALWNHYQATGDEAWLRRIGPALVRSAQATLRIRRGHPGTHRQGEVEISGWLPPIGGDGGLGHGYHWSQNTGPLAGVRIAAEAARRLRLPEADALAAGCDEFQQAIDRVRNRAVEAAGLGMVPAFPGAAGSDRTRPLWGVVMSVTAFDGIPADDPAAVATLRFLQRHQQGGLHLNLGYSPGVWPYLSAEVAQWHLRLGEREEAWRILRAIVQRASSTVCWYEEVEPNQGHGDPADAWAAAEVVYLSAQLLKPAEYRGWKSIHLDNGLVSLEIVPEIGGRLTQFRLGAKEFLWVNPQLAGKLPPESGLDPDGGWLNYGGDKLWPAPQGWDNAQQWPGPPDAVLDGQPHRAEALDGGTAVRLTSRDDPRSGIRFSRVVRLLADRSGVEFQATMTNIDTKPRRWGIWSHTQLDAARRAGDGPNRLLRAWCPLHPQSHFPQAYSVIFGAADNTSFRPHAEGRLMEVRYQYEVGKIGLDSPAGWVATVDGETGAAFVQRFVFEPDKEYPDSSSVEFWHNGVGRIHAYGKDLPQPDDPQQNPYVFESEMLSPFARLEPGQSYTWQYRWFATNLGGDQPAVDCTELALVSEPLSAQRDGVQFRLRGRFGVFERGRVEVVALDAAGRTLAVLAEASDADPWTPVVLDLRCRAVAGTAGAAAILRGADGQPRGELGRCDVPGLGP
jgi:hypothetical protein